MKGEVFRLANMSEIKYNIIKKMYTSNKVTRWLANRYIMKHEGGVFYSQSLRKIYKDVYDIDAGIGTYGCFTTNFRPHVKIGAYCSIAPGVQRLFGNHPMTNISTHPFFHFSKYGYCDKDDYVFQHLDIGNDVWIGVNAIITGSVSVIGDGAVVGAGAVVTHDVPPYAVVAGTPAKVISYRFTEQQRKRLIESKWYDLSTEDLKRLMPYRADVDRFLDEIETLQSK